MTSTRQPRLASFCAAAYSVVEHEGLLWVWRGNPLTADARQLPRSTPQKQTFECDTTLDYECDWTAVLNAQIRQMAEGALAGESVRHQAPNVVQRVGADGCVEEAHVVPIAPGRTRVLLRQFSAAAHGMSPLLLLPGTRGLLSTLGRNRNYEAALAAYPAVQERAATVEASGMPVGGSSTASGFDEWHRDVLQHEDEPFFRGWDNSLLGPKFGQQGDDDTAAGTYGLKKSYVQNTPVVEYAPMNHEPYRELVEPLKDAQQTLLAAALAVPAAMLAYKATGPALDQSVAILTKAFAT